LVAAIARGHLFRVEDRHRPFRWDSEAWCSVALASLQQRTTVCSLTLL
jgi:hypothetical protein